MCPGIHKLTHEFQGVDILDLLLLFFLSKFKFSLYFIIYLFYYTIVILIDDITEFLFHARQYS